MDLKDLKTTNEDEGVILHLKDRNDAPEFDNENPLTMLVAGRYSTRYKAAQRKQSERSYRRGAALKPEDMEQALLSIEAACIIEWPFTSEGQPFPITKDNWAAIIDVCPWYQAQVRNAIENYARIKASAA